MKPRQYGDKQSYRSDSLRPLSLGIQDSINPLLLRDGETPDCRDVDFNHESIQGQGGALKFNDQALPHSGLLTRTSMAPLFVGANAASVPQRGYGFLPYNSELDIGGDFVGDVGLPDPFAHTYHARRGKSFDFSISFALGADEKLYVSREGAGVTAPAADVRTYGSYDEALDECSLILQKGGDGLSPFSIGLGIVNTAGEFETVTGLATFDRVSNYALCFMWYDAPQWGPNSPGTMRYLVGAGGANVGTTGRYCTMALRAIMAKVFIEPGVTYHVAVSLNLDTGSPGLPDVGNPTAAWNSNGSFQIVVKDERGVTTRCATLGTDLFVWKGPTDSYDYLTRYGVRFSGRDPMFVGLGYRFSPHTSLGGFIPLGIDSAPMTAGGFRMLDVSAQAKPTAFSVAHTCTRAGGADTWVDINRRGMTNVLGTFGVHPYAPSSSAASNAWLGLYQGAGVIPHQGTAGHSEALRGYWLTFWNSATAAISGMRLRISYYWEQGGGPTPRLELEIPLAFSLTWAVPQEYFVVPFRWFQRPLHVSNLRMFNVARTWTDARTLFSLCSYSLPSDATEPNLANMIACWPMDDAGGGVLRELVNGRSGYLAPYALGQDQDGFFISGEGEAPVLDLSTNPVLVRELEAMHRSGAQGFAIEMRVTIPQAYYALSEAVGANFQTKMAPVLCEWATKDDGSGYGVEPAPLLRLGHRSLISSAVGEAPFFYPMGFTVECATDSDQVTGTPEQVLDPWSAAGPTSNWSTNAAWVGHEIRIQIGVQKTGAAADEYKVYIAATPKGVLFPAAGDPGEAEFAYFATKTIHRRDLARSIVVIGGTWRQDLATGYSEVNARLILHEVRVFGCAAPGKLPAASGGISTNRDGKLLGERALPARDLTRLDLLHPLTSTDAGINVTEGSSVVTPSDASTLFANNPEDTLEAVKETFLLVGGDSLEILHEGTEPTFQEEFYYVPSIAGGGANLTLSRNFNDKTQLNAEAKSFRVIGYTSFNDDLGLKALPIGRGTPYQGFGGVPSTAVVTEGYFENLAPVTAEWKMRVFASQISAKDIVPLWSRGLGIPRKNPVLGLWPHKGRLYAAVRGALYEADDRWRLDGPTPSVAQSLALRGSLVDVGEHGLALPLEKDRVRFDTVTGIKIDDTIAGSRRHFDAWVKVDEYAAFQTVIWMGDPTSNPAQSAGRTAGTQRLNYWIRLANGYPELVLGSTATYDGTNRPERGLFIASCATRIKRGEWVHLRWTVSAGATVGWISSTPYCFVNGKRGAVSLNASENAAATGDWLNTANLSTGTTLILGAAHDSFLAPGHDKTFANGILEGELLVANRHQGWLHSLDGLLARVAISSSALVLSFDPQTLTYTSPLFLALDTQTPVGHKVLDSAVPQYGLIESHPGVSMFHEMGLHTKPASWANYDDRLFVTTGGRPVYAQVTS